MVELLRPFIVDLDDVEAFRLAAGDPTGASPDRPE
jgi:hypothetical protein